MANAESHIVVVDDEPGIRSALVRYLSGEGFKVTPCADGTALRHALDGDTVDLILMDLMMPGEDGLALARFVRTRSAVPIIMLTSVGQVTGMKYGRDNDLVPVDVFFEKPVRPDDLLQAVSGLLKK